MSLYLCDGCGVAVTNTLPHTLTVERSHNGLTRGSKLQLCVRCADDAERDLVEVLAALVARRAA